MFKKLANIYNTGSAVSIRWNYEDEDENMLEARNDYQDFVKLLFKMVSVPE